MGLNFDTEAGQTRLDEDEIEGLLLYSVTTRGELDEFEQENIERAVIWTLGRTLPAERLFSEEFVRQLHVRMFGDVWALAGKFRSTDKNLGIDKWHIASALKALLDDALYWHVHAVYPPDELAIRFKHRLVSIHCFPNGNGRHSRLIADVVASNLYGQPPFSWGARRSASGERVRSTYMQALRTADAGEVGPLVAFARS